jgi:hypothetical protein
MSYEGYGMLSPGPRSDVLEGAVQQRNQVQQQGQPQGPSSSLLAIAAAHKVVAELQSRCLVLADKLCGSQNAAEQAPGSGPPAVNAGLIGELSDIGQQMQRMATVGLLALERIERSLP